MTRGRPWRQLGLTLLEFTLFTIIMGALIALGLQRIAAVRVHVERAAVEHNVARMREALAVEFAELVVRNRLGELAEYAGANPLERFNVVTDYIGVRRMPAEGKRQAGQWYYDAAIGNVVYVPRFPSALEWPDGQPRLLRWRVRPQWQDVDGNGEFDRYRDRAYGIELVRMDDARWR